MQSWVNKYNSKRSTLEEAVKHIKSGDTVYLHPGNATPALLIKGMVNRAHELFRPEKYE